MAFPHRNLHIVLLLTWSGLTYVFVCSVWEAYKREMAGQFLFGQEHPSLLTALGKQEVTKAGTKEEGEGKEEEKGQFPELENIDLIITEDTESKAKVRKSHAHTHTHTHIHAPHTHHTLLRTSLQSIQCEIERLDSSIAGGLPVDTLPIHLCRRGALLRKVPTVEHPALPSLCT